MQIIRRDFKLFLMRLILFALLLLLLTVCMEARLSEPQHLLNSINALDPGNTLQKLDINVMDLDISNNQFTRIFRHSNKEFKLMDALKSSRKVQSNDLRRWVKLRDSGPPPSSDHRLEESSNTDSWEDQLKRWIPLFLGIGFAILIIYYVGNRSANLAHEKQNLNSSFHESPSKACIAGEEVKKCSELVFFVGGHERFNLEDLLEATAHLRSQNICSSLFKVILGDNVDYAVKRLKKLQVSIEEFAKVMKQIANLKHPNILPIVAYYSTNVEKIFIYNYQCNGSLLDLLDNYIGSKKEFPWRLRLSIAGGIARGLDFIYQKSSEDRENCIPHGNLKLSNILLDENYNPLISEYGIAGFLDPKGDCLIGSTGYIAPEKSITEEADIYSFGVIFLELLTGKIVERSGIDLPKWVRAMVGEEWTGEVFDKEVGEAAHQWAFPLLNIALQCVSRNPEDRPKISEVLSRIEEAIHAQHDHSISSMSSDYDHHESYRQQDSS